MPNLTLSSTLEMFHLKVTLSRLTRRDFNAHLDPELDNAGRQAIKQHLVKNVIDIKLPFDLVDIRRIRNTDEKQCIWRQKRSLIQVSATHCLSVSSRKLEALKSNNVT